MTTTSVPIVYWNGRYVPADEARVSVFDRGFLYGDGLFETMRADSGRVHLLDRHIERLFAGLGTMRISVPETPVVFGRAIEETVARNGGGDVTVRVTVSRGEHRGVTAFRDTGEPTRVIAVRPFSPSAPEVIEAGISVVTVRGPAREASPSRGLKTLSYVDFLFYKDWADRQGVQEAIILDERERVVEGSSSNVFVVADGAVLTPPLGEGMLPGVVRARVIELSRSLGIVTMEKTVTADDLRRADEIFLTNSVWEVLGVAYIADWKLVKNADPTVTRRLRRAFDDDKAQAANAV